MTQREDKKTLESRRNELADEIGQLEKELKQREEQLPAHSIRPHQIMAIEKLEEKIRQKKEQLQVVQAKLSEFQNSPRSN